jgi:hypothetical protein
MLSVRLSVDATARETASVSALEKVQLSKGKASVRPSAQMLGALSKGRVLVCSWAQGLE